MLKLFLFSLLVACTYAQYTKLQYSMCGTSQLTFYDLDVTPMPIIHPGPARLILSGKNNRAIKGVVKGDVNIVRSVSGVSLPVRCYSVDGFPVGSCTYTDLCDLLKRLFQVDASNCPVTLLNNDITCTCPFNLPVRELDIDHTIELVDAASTQVTWLGSGEFDITVKGSDAQGQILCLNLKFSVRPKK